MIAVSEKSLTAGRRPQADTPIENLIIPDHLL